MNKRDERADSVLLIGLVIMMMSLGWLFVAGLIFQSRIRAPIVGYGIGFVIMAIGSMMRPSRKEKIEDAYVEGMLSVTPENTLLTWNEERETEII